jgi:hypothetical protein
MSQLRRFESCGAIFTDKLDSVADLRNRGFSIVGNPTVVSSSRGVPVIDFDGTADAINTGSDFIGAQSLTVSCWIKIDSYGETAGRILDNGNLIFSVRNDGTLANGVQFISNGATSALSAANAITTGTWYHVAVSRVSSGGSTTNIYINGVLSGTANQSSGTPAAGSTNVFIGSNGVGTRDFDGQISDLMVFNRVLTATEISQIYNNTVFNYMDSLISMWDMSEINPQDLGYKGNGNHLTGTSIASTDIVDGNNSKTKAINFDGTNDYFSRTNTSATTLYPQENMTFVAWLNPNTHAVNGRVIRIYQDADNEYQCVISTTQRLVFTFRRNGVTADAGGAANQEVTIGAWQQVAWRVANSTTLGFNINGENKDGGNNGLITQTNPTFDIGFSSGASKYSGKAAKIYVFNASLTDIQLKDLYERTK